MNPSLLNQQIEENRRSVAFDSYDITVRQLREMVSEEIIDIAPDYQRHFVWDKVRQSQLIESLFLGIPIPSLFMATNPDSTWEVIDGLQRITTLMNFLYPEGIASSQNNFTRLKIEGLEKIPEMNGCYFSELPKSNQIMFETRPMRITVLNDRSDFAVRYDLFERLNTGGIILNPQEIRNCVFLGEFSEFLKNCAGNEAFKNCVKLSRSSQKKANMEELVLKFFAYFEKRDDFKHSVKEFLNDYMEQRDKEFTSSDKRRLTNLFESTFNYLSENLENGIVRGNRINSTPLVLYEAISVGVADLIDEDRAISADRLAIALDNEDLKKLTTGATNSKTRLNGRIDLVKELIAV